MSARRIMPTAFHGEAQGLGQIPNACTVPVGIKQCLQSGTMRRESRWPGRGEGPRRDGRHAGAVGSGRGAAGPAGPPTLPPIVCAVPATQD